MDPVVKMWMFNNWVEDYNEKFDTLKNHAILTGSFTNPDAAKKMLGKGVTKISLTDEEFEESMKMIDEEIKQEQKQGQQKNNTRKRKRKKLLNR